jgi:spore germination cell wall hydrolase CwlJ-like protein
MMLQPRHDAAGRSFELCRKRFSWALSMSTSRTRPRGAAAASFGLCAFAFALLPAPIGPQDLAAYLGPKAEAAIRTPALASPFGTIHLATYSLPRPLGTTMPQPSLTLVRLDPSDIDFSGTKGSRAVAPTGGAIVFPEIDRRRKGDSLLPASPPPRETAHELPPEPITELSEDDGVWPELDGAEMASTLNPTMDTARLYFGVGSMDAPIGDLERAPADEVSTEPAAPTSANRDVDIKRSAAAPSAPGTTPQTEPSKGGETVAGKGVVTGERQRPRSPAERLGLSGKARARAEKCLANAVYFESRGEPVRGQIAVAQVVMNRVFSEFYPDNVCDVVYQNANRHLACQFTFACDGIRDVVTEPAAWRRAKRIANDMLDGKLWLSEIGWATHYHAYWVRPSWVREMRKLYKVGVHTFYRPRAWGSGADEPKWGDPATTAALAKTL